MLRSVIGLQPKGKNPLCQESKRFFQGFMVTTLEAPPVRGDFPARSKQRRAQTGVRLPVAPGTYVPAVAIRATEISPIQSLCRGFPEVSKRHLHRLTATSIHGNQPVTRRIHTKQTIQSTASVKTVAIAEPIAPTRGISTTLPTIFTTRLAIVAHM